MNDGCFPLFYIHFSLMCWARPVIDSIAACRALTVVGGVSCRPARGWKGRCPKPVPLSKERRRARSELRRRSCPVRARRRRCFHRAGRPHSVLPSPAGHRRSVGVRQFPAEPLQAERRRRASSSLSGERVCRRVAVSGATSLCSSARACR
jgi:hypothetical protein